MGTSGTRTGTSGTQSFTILAPLTEVADEAEAEMQMNESSQKTDCTRLKYRAVPGPLSGE